MFISDIPPLIIWQLKKDRTASQLLLELSGQVSGQIKEQRQPEEEKFACFNFLLQAISGGESET